MVFRQPLLVQKWHKQPSKVVVRRTNTDVSSVASPHTGKGLYSSEEALIFEARTATSFSCGSAAYLNLQHHVRGTAPSQATTERLLCAGSRRAPSEAFQATRWNLFNRPAAYLMRDASFIVN